MTKVFVVLVVGFSFVFGACEAMNERARTDKAFYHAVAKHNKKAKQKDKLICRREKTLGSNFTHMVCRSVFQRDVDRGKASQNILRFRQMGEVKSGGE
jgi:hypothetical protein